MSRFPVKIATDEFEVDGVRCFSFKSKVHRKFSMQSHVYFVDGLLVDTGHARARSQVMAAMDNHSIDKIFITHHHEDHTGNILPLLSGHDCKVYGSRECVELLKEPPALSLPQRIVWGNRESFHQMLPIEKELITKNFKFQIIPIPGHAKDMLALYEPRKKWLFSGDLFISSRLGYFLGNESISDQIASIKKVLTLDFNFMFCGHNPIFENPKNALSKKLDALEAVFDDIRVLKAHDFSLREIFKYLELKEYRLVKFLSRGKLSKLNLIKAVLRDLELEDKENQRRD